MKLNPKRLNPEGPEPSQPPIRVCGAKLADGSGTCQVAVSGNWRCRAHGGPSGFEDAETGLPDGVTVHKAFDDEARQLELERYVGSILREYELNEAADMRQTILSGIAYVKLLFDGATMAAKDMDAYSKVVDRHLRNLRATPKEQTSGRQGPGDQDGGGALGAGIAVGALLQRVASVLTAPQVAALKQGRTPATGSRVEPDSGPLPAEAEVLAPDAPDPFGD